MRETVGEDRGPRHPAAPPFVAPQSTQAPKWPRAPTAKQISKAFRRFLPLVDEGRTP